LRPFGHEVKLIAPQLVKPYEKGGKNDSAGAGPTSAFYEDTDDDEGAKDDQRKGGLGFRSPGNSAM
jgi:hypothetical protein